MSGWLVNNEFWVLVYTVHSPKEKASLVVLETFCILRKGCLLAIKNKYQSENNLILILP
jgi:hypothetical protein